MFGEIHICQFPFTSGTGGKVRPALVLFDLSHDAVICRTSSLEPVRLMKAGPGASLLLGQN